MHAVLLPSSTPDTHYLQHRKRTVEPVVIHLVHDPPPP